MIDTAGLAFAFWAFILCWAGAVLGAWLLSKPPDDDDEIVERKRLNLIVRWPK